jgi:hypothetical protein
MAPDYVFHPISAGDLSPVRHWLETPDDPARLMARDR